MRSLFAIGLGVSFLFTSVSTAIDLVPFGSEWSYWHTVDGLDGDPSNTDADFVSTWFLPDYDTTTPLPWAAPAPGPFAYGDADAGGTPNVFHIDAFTPGSLNFRRDVGTFLEQPPGERFTTYFRTTFTNDADSRDIGIELLADDGAKIYLDGEEVTSWNCCEIAGPGTPSDFAEFSSFDGFEDRYVIGRLLGGEALAAGEHTLAVAVHQSTSDSSDLGFSLRLIEGYIEEELIETGQEWSYFKGLEEPSSGTLDWTTAGFDDSRWESGVEGFGYDNDPNTLTANILGTPLPDMETDYTSLYVRKAFELSEDPSAYQTLFFNVDFDDGFLAYINGIEVVQAIADTDNDPTTGIPFDMSGEQLGAAAESTNGSGAPGITLSIDLEEFPDLLNPGGDNVLAIHGINRSPSSDYVLAQLGLLGVGERPGPTGIVGDFSGNGELDIADVEALSIAIQSANGDAEFDLDSSGEVDGEDLRVWIEDLRGSYLGDANLDGEFNSRDFVTVFTAQEYEDDIDGNSTWAEGDWNGDGDFNTRDFVTAFAGGGYEKGPRPAAVPESSAIAMLVIGALSLSRRQFHA